MLSRWMPWLWIEAAWFAARAGKECCCYYQRCSARWNWNSLLLVAAAYDHN